MAMQSVMILMGVFALVATVVIVLGRLVFRKTNYMIEKVTFNNGDITLAGTLTLPSTEGTHPAVVLMTGTGPQDRDSVIIPGFRIFQPNCRLSDTARYCRAAL